MWEDGGTFGEKQPAAGGVSPAGMLDCDHEENGWPKALAWSAVAIIVGFAWNPIPSLLVPPRSCGYSLRYSCVNNLRMIHGAKETWAIENGLGTNAVPTTNDLFGPTLYIRRQPQCPDGGSYTLNAVHQNPTCSIRGHTL